MNRGRFSSLVGAVLVLGLASASALEASPVTVEWDANSEPDLAGYVVSYGTAPGVYTVSVDVGNQTSWQFDLVAGETYYFAVTAYNSSALSSAFSNEVSAVAGEPFLTNPGNQSDAEGTAITLALVASDPDGDTLSYSETGLPLGLSVDSGTGEITGTVSFVAATGSPYSVTASVSDGVLSSSATFTWTVSNANGQPAITSPGNQSDAEGTAITLALVASDPDGDTLSYSATGLPPDLSVDAGTGEITGTVSFTAATGSPYSVTASVSDGVLSASAIFTWTVTDTNRPPVITLPESQSDAEGAAITLALVASDPDGDTLSYSAPGLPPGLSVDAGTGEITGTVSFTAATGSPYSVTAAVSDGVLSSSASFTWTVSDVNGPPAITSPGNQSDAEGTAITLALVASDPDGDTLSYSAPGLPAGLSVDAGTGDITGTVSFTAAAGSPYSVTASVSDGVLNASTAFTWMVSETNRAPVIASPGDQSDAEGTAVTLALVASDPDGHTLSYSATGLPPGLSVDTGTGAITGTVSFVAAAGSPYGVTASASDGVLNASTAFTWMVSETNRAPVIASPGDQSDAEGTAVTLALVASDPDGHTLSYSATELPPGLSLDAATGAIAGTVSLLAAAGSPYSVTASVSDGVLTASTTFTWMVNATNQPPVISSPGDQSAAEGTAITLALVASDPDEDTLSYSAPGLPPGLSLDASTGNITGMVSFESAAGSPYSVTASVSDGVLSASTTFTWTVRETNQPPVISSPGDQSDGEGTAVTLALVASDPDGDTLSHSATELPPGLSLDAATGAITGTVSVGAAAGSPYSVTASVSDGVLHASTTFTWTASEAQGPVSLVLSRSEVRFGATENGAITTGAQEVWVHVIGSDTLSWTATSSDPTVVQVAPSSGTGTGALTIAINQSQVYPDTLVGEWTVTVDAGRVSNSPQVVQVPFRVYPAGQTTAPFGAFDTPTDQATGLEGSVAVTGWAVDDIEVTRVELWRDAFGSEVTYVGPGQPWPGKVFIGTGTFVDGSRPDVETAYPAQPLAYRAGWGYVLLTRGLPWDRKGCQTLTSGFGRSLTRSLQLAPRIWRGPSSNTMSTWRAWADCSSTFQVYAVAYDADGHATMLGAKTISLDNASATQPFGTIDTPAPGATISGSGYVNFGWVLTPNGKSVPHGAAVQVAIDGVVVGSPGCYAPRADITASFPGFLNTPDAVRCLVLDTTQYSNGLHTIEWLVTDDAGVQAGLGSRVFRIFNAAAGATGFVGSGLMVPGPARADARTAFPGLGALTTSLTMPDRGAGVGVARGAMTETAAEVFPDARGVRLVRLEELERVQIQLPGPTGAYRAYQVVNQELRTLPVGSSFDTRRGVFYWQPGAGFVGHYDFIFVRAEDTGDAEQVRVRLLIEPPHVEARQATALMVLDTPVFGEVVQPFVVAGWAIDLAAWSGTGVDAVHVWAYPTPGSGATPIFLGVADPGGVRPAVGAVYGDDFVPSGYELTVFGLAPGVYDVVAYAHSTVTGTFNNAHVVRITVY